MDKATAQKLVQETLQGFFNKGRFVYLLKNILNSFDESKAFHVRGYVKEKFRTTTYRKMEAIFQLRLLQELGFTQTEIRSVVDKSYRLRRKLEKL